MPDGEPPIEGGTEDDEAAAAGDEYGFGGRDGEGAGGGLAAGEAIAPGSSAAPRARPPPRRPRPAAARTKRRRERPARARSSGSSALPVPSVPAVSASAGQTKNQTTAPEPALAPPLCPSRCRPRPPRRRPCPRRRRSSRERSPPRRRARRPRPRRRARRSRIRRPRPRPRRPPSRPRSAVPVRHGGLSPFSPGACAAVPSTRLDKLTTLNMIETVKAQQKLRPLTSLHDEVNAQYSLEMDKHRLSLAPQERQLHELQLAAQINEELFRKTVEPLHEQEDRLRLENEIAREKFSVRGDQGRLRQAEDGPRDARARLRVRKLRMETELAEHKTVGLKVDLELREKKADWKKQANREPRLRGSAVQGRRAGPCPPAHRDERPHRRRPGRLRDRSASTTSTTRTSPCRSSSSSTTAPAAR